MYDKSFLAFAAIALSTATTTVAAVAQPSCLIAAVNTQPNPADSTSICGSNASRVQSEIQRVCGADQQAALDIFASVCKADGVIVAPAQPLTTSTPLSGTLPPSDSSNSNSISNSNSNNIQNDSEALSLRPDSNPDSALDTDAPSSSIGLAFDTSIFNLTSSATGKSSSLSASTPGASATATGATGTAGSGSGSSASSSPGAKSTGKSEGTRVGPVSNAGSIVGLVVAAAGVIFAL